MNITRENYEVFFIDYWEGQLSQDEKDMLFDFIDSHPDKKNEFEDMKSLFETPEEEPAFTLTHLLKKNINDKEHINDKNIDEFIIAYLENELSHENTLKLETFLKQNPSYQKDLQLYQKTFQEPDTSIVFENKRALKKFIVGQNTLVRKISYAVVSIAASIVLAVAFFAIDLNNNTETRLGKSIVKTEKQHIEKQPLLSTNAQIITATHNPKSKFDKSPPQIVKPNNNLMPTSIIKKQNNALSLSDVPLLAYDNRNTYSNMYDYIKKADLNSMEEDYSDILKTETDESFLRFLVQKVFSDQEKSNRRTPENNVQENLWLAAEIGIEGLNSLSNRKLFGVNRVVEDNKTRTDFAFNGQTIYSRTKNN